MKKKTIAVDFDGVINSYTSGFNKRRIPDPPNEGAIQFLDELVSKGYPVVLHSTRASSNEDVELMRVYLSNHGLSERARRAIIISDKKPMAGLYIDDRGYRFTGSFPSLHELDYLCEHPGETFSFATTPQREDIKPSRKSRKRSESPDD